MYSQLCQLSININILLKKKWNHMDWERVIWAYSNESEDGEPPRVDELSCQPRPSLSVRNWPPFACVPYRDFPQVSWCRARNANFSQDQHAPFLLGLTCLANSNSSYFQVDTSGLGPCWHTHNAKVCHFVSAEAGAGSECGDRFSK